jgi:hypothetical protein
MLPDWAVQSESHRNSLTVHAISSFTGFSYPYINFIIFETDAS